MKRRNLRFRITLALTTICCLLVSAFGVGLYSASEKMEFALVEQLMTEELDFLVQRHAADSRYEPTQRSRMEYYIMRPGAADEAPAFLSGLQEGHHEVRAGDFDGERDVIVRDVAGWRYAVVYDIGPYEASEARFKHFVLLALLGATALTPLLGFATATYLTRQLSHLTQQVTTMEPDQARIPLLRDDQDLEVAALATAFDHYHDFLRNLVRREQQFTANVSHELRTPLTAIRTSCELLAQDAGLSSRSRTRVEGMRRTVDEMSRHVEALLLLAREGQLPAEEDFALRECVDAALTPLSDQLAGKGLSCEVLVHAELVLRSNRQALGLVLANLMRNAVSYTEAGRLQVVWTDGGLEIRDTGTGIPADALARIFARDYRGPQPGDGIGIGLDIVRKVCERSGWEISVHSTVGKGSTFRLAFPPATVLNAG